MRTTKQDRAAARAAWLAWPDPVGEPDRDDPPDTFGGRSRPYREHAEARLSRVANELDYEAGADPALVMARQGRDVWPFALVPGRTLRTSLLRLRAVVGHRQGLSLWLATATEGDVRRIRQDRS